MNEHDPMAGEGDADRSLVVALSDLAETMPDDPTRVDDVHARVRRLRNRRRATRAAGAVVVATATIAALVAIRPGRSEVSTIPAGQASATTIPPSCAVASAAAVPPTGEGPPAVPSEARAAATKRAAADGATAEGTAGAGRRGVKGLGAVVSASETSLTVRLDELYGDEPNGVQPSEITATFSPDVEFMDGATAVDVRPALAAGDPVAFAASQAADGTYQLNFVAVHPAPAGTASPGSRGVKGHGTVVSASETSVTITVAEPNGDQPSEITATFGPHAEYVDGAVAVDVRPALAAGDLVAFEASQAPDGSYRIAHLAVHLPEPTSSGARTDAVDDSSSVKTVAQVADVGADGLTLVVREGSLVGQTVHASTGPGTVYSVGSQRCVDPALAPGDVVGVLLVKGPGGSYSVEALALSTPPGPGKA